MSTMIDYAEIKIGDSITITVNYKDGSTIIWVGTVTHATKHGYRSAHSGFSIFGSTSMTVELVHREDPLAHKLAKAYGAADMEGLNRFARFEKLVEHFGLEL